MKKVWILLLAITVGFSVFAQDSATSMSKMAPGQHIQNHEGVIMRDGKLLMMKNGQTTQLTSDLTLDNGAVVMTNGSVKTKEGTVTLLKEGDYIGMDGSMGNMKTRWPKNNMGDSMHDKMKADSVK